MTAPISGAFKGVSYNGAFGSAASDLARAGAAFAVGRRNEEERRRQAAMEQALMALREQEMGLNRDKFSAETEQNRVMNARLADELKLNRDQFGFQREKFGAEQADIPVGRQHESSESALERQNRLEVARINAASRENVADTRADASVNRPKLVQGTDGTWYTVMPGEVAPGQAAPVTQGGSPLHGTAAKATSTQVGQVADNNAAVGQIQEAMLLAQSRPESFGLKYMLPDIANQRTDPQGVDARAAVANIGSMQIKLRSGAAVTAKEFPRLAPFVPNVTDTGDAVLEKLRLLQREVERINAEIAEQNPNDPRVNGANNGIGDLMAKYGLE